MQTNENEIVQMVQHIQRCPIPMRISLARQILESVEREPERAPAPRPERGPSAAEVAAMFQTEQSVTDHATVKQWIGEHRMTKYGS